MKLSSITTLRQFAPASEISAILSATRGEEGAYFRAKVDAIAQVIDTMPCTYGQDGLGDDAIAYLHYFKGSAAWYITERDIGAPGDMEQRQAFGMVDLGYGPELGYISIVELIQNGVELDLYFTPTTLASLKGKS